MIENGEYKVIRLEETDIDIPKRIIVGDPSYFDDDKTRHLIYLRDLQNESDWIVDILPSH